MDLDKIEKGIRLLLDGLGENIEREGLKNTPRRVSKMYSEILDGIDKKPHLKSGFAEEISPDNFILVKDILFYSVCEHHLLPFFGKADILYIPQNNLVAGFSNLVEIVEILSHRLQIQERLTNQIADAINESLNPKGVGVVLEATQLCVCMRRKQSGNIRTITRAIRGEISKEQVPVNFLSR
jgi:GTP cyclohydrolase I